MVVILYKTNFVAKFFTNLMSSRFEMIKKIEARANYQGKDQWVTEEKQCNQWKWVQEKVDFNLVLLWTKALVEFNWKMMNRNQWRHMNCILRHHKAGVLAWHNLNTSLLGTTLIVYKNIEDYKQSENWELTKKMTLTWSLITTIKLKNRFRM